VLLSPYWRMLGSGARLEVASKSSPWAVRPARLEPPVFTEPASSALHVASVAVHELIDRQACVAQLCEQVMVVVAALGDAVLHEEDVNLLPAPNW
jgi:hypothetical protein